MPTSERRQIGWSADIPTSARRQIGWSAETLKTEPKSGRHVSILQIIISSRIITLFAHRYYNNMEPHRSERVQKACLKEYRRNCVYERSPEESPEDGMLTEFHSLKFVGYGIHVPLDPA